jgi:hypothetical protein
LKWRIEMPHIGTEKSWKDLLEFFFASLDYVPTLRRVMVAQWIHASREPPGGAPGASELAKKACNFGNLRYSERMRAYGAGEYVYKGEKYCSFQNVEHFIDGYFHFIATGPYDRWHLLANRPIDFVAHLQENGFAGTNHNYVNEIREIYEGLAGRYKIAEPEIQAEAHVVSHGDFAYKVAAEYGADVAELFRVSHEGRVSYGNAVGTLFTGDVLFVITDGIAAVGHDLGAGQNPLSGLVACDRPEGDCAGRTHFVLHQTVDGNLTRSSVISRYGGLRNKAHVYVLKSGETVFLWPFTEKEIRATKAEYPTVKKYKPAKGSFPSYPITGKLIHVEIDYEDKGEPNESQYGSTALLYIEACKVVGRILTIVPHIEVDRGIRNGHNDPQNFKYEHFYSVLEGLGVDMDSVPKFSDARYWGKSNYKTPWDTDKFQYPPALDGDPHA